MRQLSKSIAPAINPSHNRHDLVPLVFQDLIRLESPPHHLIAMAYEWCSLICENSQGLNLKDRERLLLLSLKIGFRRLDPGHQWIEDLRLNHTEHHRGLADVVFESGDSEAIADLLHAWTLDGQYYRPTRTLLGICTGHLVDLHNRVPFSSRLRRLVIRSVEVIGYKGFEGVGVERFIELLNYLHVTVEDMDRKFKWANLLLDTLQSPEGIRHLPHWYWELLVELALTTPRWLRDENPVYNSQVVKSLTEAEEWDKLECWVGTIWIIWPPGASRIKEDDLEWLTLLLFYQRPGAVQKLTQWMERWGGESGKEVPASFERICRKVREAAQQDLL